MCESNQLYTEYSPGTLVMFTLSAIVRREPRTRQLTGRIEWFVQGSLGIIISIVENSREQRQHAFVVSCDGHNTMGWVLMRPDWFKHV